jgi:ATP-dependent exoDNAse (exonuclease V) beta subunit
MYKTLDHDDLSLNEETHTYFLKSDSEFSFRSCTEFLGLFFDKFDSEKVAKELVASNYKYKNRTVESVLEEWAQSALFGQEVHYEIEMYLKEGSDVIQAQSSYAIEWLQKKMPSERYTFYPELKIYSEKLKLAGTIDLLAFDNTKQRYYLLDWKTNKRITTRSFNNKKGIKEPTLHIEDCHLHKYGLQMSLYRYLLKQEYNIDVEKQAIMHLTPKKAEVIPCLYTPDVIHKMLKSERLL